MSSEAQPHEWIADSFPTTAVTSDLVEEVVRPAAYGMRFRGVLPRDLLAVRGAGHWPEVEVELGERAGPEAESQANYLSLTLQDGTTIRMHEETGALSICPRPEPDELVHPLLSAAALMRARSSGQEALHAGSFASATGAWLVLAEKECGKTTLLARLHLAGYAIVADDVAILDHGSVMAGPRCLDLRADMADEMAIGRPIRRDHRFRVELPPADAEYAVTGMIDLRWADQTEVRLVPPAERLRLLQAASGYRPRRDPTELLDLATVPYYRISRPRSTADIIDLLPREVLDA